MCIFAPAACGTRDVNTWKAAARLHNDTDQLKVQPRYGPARGRLHLLFTRSVSSHRVASGQMCICTCMKQQASVKQKGASTALNRRAAASKKGCTTGMLRTR